MVNVMRGFNVKQQVKGNYGLLPIVCIATFACCLAAAASYRTMTKNPDVVINRRGKPKPYEDYVQKDGKGIPYKYYKPSGYVKYELDPERPKLD